MGGGQLEELSVPCGEEVPRYYEQRSTGCGDGGDGVRRGREAARLLVPC
jgi:hypothetical protein